jgi:hypothetical protein
MDNGVLMELKHSHRTHTSLHTGPDACIFRISRLRVTYEVRKFPANFIVVVLKILMVFGSYIKRN